MYCAFGAVALKATENHLNNSRSTGRRLAGNTVFFSYTGDYQTFTVPDFVTSMTVTASGAGRGAITDTYTCYGGYGGVVTATISVTNGSTYYIYVGQQATDWIGGYNGGGNGNVICGGGGNGATDIRTSLNDLSSRIIVAGGGGGCYPCCSDANGGAGGRYGVDGETGCSSGGGGGATPSSGGVTGGDGGNDGIFGFGGAAANQGAGGGGGYYGGGSADSGGGGGGSSYGPEGATFFTGLVEGNGMLTISYDYAPTSQPSSQPSGDPSSRPTEQPTSVPTLATAAPSQKRSSFNLIYTIAGTGSQGDENSESAATAVALNSPRAVWQTAGGVIYFSDYDGCCVRRFSTTDGTLHAVAGQCGLCDYTVSGVQATASFLSYPIGVAADTLGSIYIGDSGTCYVHKISTDGILSIYFGTNIATNSGDGGPASSAAIYAPGSVWVNTAGVLYVSSNAGYKIRSVDSSGTAHTLAG